jgi:hypothetical protein
MYKEGGHLDLRLKGEIDLNHCKGELHCDHKNFLFLQFTYCNSFFQGKNNSCILLLSFLHKRCFCVYTYLHLHNITSRCMYIMNFQLYGCFNGVANANLSRFLLKGTLPRCYNNQIYSVL